VAFPRIERGQYKRPRVGDTCTTQVDNGDEMSVYFVVQEQVDDPAGLEKYMKAARASSLGRGRALVVDDDVCSIEGDWHGSRLVILEFDDEEAFRDWYDSPEYQAALPLRLASTDSRGALAKGLS
jgi:uncharacterized protein (DUF1330 family)